MKILDVLLLVTLPLLAACRADPAPAAGRQAAQGDVAAIAAPADGAPALAATDIDYTPEDSAIVRRTLDWARAERLDTLPIGEIVARVGRRFVGAPYVPKTLDPPGPERLIVNLRTFDCVTFVENTLAISRVIRDGGGFPAFTRELAGIRYRDGAPDGYPSRLHYFSDWIAANDRKGIVRNVTPELSAAVDSTPIDFMSAHTSAYRQLADSANLRAIRETERQLSRRGRSWIPEADIAAVADRIQDGDIIAATSTVSGLDIAHTGIALRVDGVLRLMHAPLVGEEVQISDESLADRILRIAGQDGIMVARPR